MTGPVALACAPAMGVDPAILRVRVRTRVRVRVRVTELIYQIGFTTTF